MGKFGIFGRPEDKALELMIGEHKSAAETSRILASEQGVQIAPDSLRRLKKEAFETLVAEKREEQSAEFLLESIGKVIIKFEDIYDKFETIYTKFEEEGRTFEQLVVLRDLKEMLNMALKKLGEYKSAFEQIKVKNINIINASDIMIAIKQQQDNWFNEMDPALADGKLIFNKPKAEIIDAYYKWNFRKKRELEPERI